VKAEVHFQEYRVNSYLYRGLAILAYQSFLKRQSWFIFETLSGIWNIFAL